MKRLGLILAVIGSLFIAANCFAVSVQTPGIVLVEADAQGLLDTDTTVIVDLEAALYDYEGGLWTLGEMVDGEFRAFTLGEDDTDSTLPGIQIKREGGEVIDFAIQGLNSENALITLFLSDTLGHTVVFKESEYVKNPDELIPGYVTDWYDGASIQWIGSNVPEISLTILSVLTGALDSDGIAPVPIPATALLFCSSILGIVGIRRKMSK